MKNCSEWTIEQMLVFTTRRVRPAGITAPWDPACNLQKYKKLKISKYTIQKNTNTIHISRTNAGLYQQDGQTDGDHTPKGASL